MLVTLQLSYLPVSLRLLNRQCFILCINLRYCVTNSFLHHLPSYVLSQGYVHLSLVKKHSQLKLYWAPSFFLGHWHLTIFSKAGSTLKDWNFQEWNPGHATSQLCSPLVSSSYCGLLWKTLGFQCHVDWLFNQWMFAIHKSANFLNMSQKPYQLLLVFV